MRMPLQPFLVLSFCACASAAACAALQRDAAVPTLSLLEVASSAETYKGRTIRTCGPKYQQRLPGSSDVWELVQPQAVGYHPASVLVIPCRHRTPRRTAAGKCVTGRVAALDASLREPDIKVFSSAPQSQSSLLRESGCRAIRQATRKAIRMAQG